MTIIILRSVFTTILCAAIAVSALSTPLANKMVSISIVPKPLHLKQQEGAFLLSQVTRLVVAGKSDELQRVGGDLAARLRSVTGFPIPLKSGEEGRISTGAITLALVKEKSIGPEAYRLSSTTKGVLIEGSTPAGVFYGIQTLYQLLPPDVEGGTIAAGVVWTVPCVRIEDAPRFPWRGMHLDVCRHFFTKDSVKRYIDLIASYKMNTFHWHLTDDQGWRIEIKKYPKLTSIGAWRRETMGDCTPHGGFYTQDDVREVVEYARQRFITVVPEIEMPGHALAALASYPELSCSGGPFKVGTEWGVINDVFCAGSEKTFEFIDDVIGEVAALFPGPFFHIGGDECPKLRWSNCVRCQQRMKEEGLTNEQELQSYFIKRVEKMLTARGKRLVGWDEILEGGLAPNATVMSWRGIQGGIEAAKSGHDVVMTPTSYCYFDYYQGQAGEPKAIGGYLPIDSVYAYEPIPPDLTPEEAHHVLGAQGNVWTEWIPNYRQVEYMATTRMMALSEVVWSDKSQRDLTDFLTRLNPQYKRLTIRDVNFRVPLPLGAGGRQIIFQDTTVTLASPIPDGAIYYTLDGRDPTSSSTPYSGPITIKGDHVLKSILIPKGSKPSNVLTAYYLTVDPNVNGLAYDYYQGEWSVLPDMNALQPNRTGTAYDITPASVPTRGRNYALRFRGGIALPADGQYTFSLASDDGSKLYIDGAEVIDNDGLHGTVEKSSTLTLKGGDHKIEVRYFQSWAVRDLAVSIEGPDMPKQQIPPRMFLLR